MTTGGQIPIEKHYCSFHVSSSPFAHTGYRLKARSHLSTPIQPPLTNFADNTGDPVSLARDNIYFHMPTGWGLQQTTLAPGRDKTRGQGSFGLLIGGANLGNSRDSYPKLKKNGPYTGPILLRQGEPVMSQYAMMMIVWPLPRCNGRQYWIDNASRTLIPSRVCG